MSRKFGFFVLLSLCLTFIASFGVAAHALQKGGSPSLPQALPASQLPPVGLSNATAVEINDLIGPEAIDRFGITSDSFSQARDLADTSIGTFYLIPGSDGACVVVSSAVACGTPGVGNENVLALAQTSPNGDALIGAGIATATTSHVDLEHADGTIVATLPVTHGVFLLNRSITAAHPLDLRFGADQ